MGADLCLACVSLRTDKKGNIKFFSKDNIEHIIGYFKVTEAEANCFIEGHSGGTEDPEVSATDAFYELAPGVVSDFFDCIGNRDVASIIYRKFITVVSGGLTWGNDPSDSFDTIEKFNYLPDRLLEKFGVIWP